MRIYLDNCSYNRPYDDQSQLRISLETQAKLQIQSMIKDGKLELAASYVLQYENSRNPLRSKRNSIWNFVKENLIAYIDIDRADEVKKIADEIIETGVKTADAYHTACAILSECDYLITTDDRLLKYKSDKIKIVDPTTFIRETEVQE
ncbi:MAG: hypothetical protein NC041_06395 [Bacteroides sp.]|nr:hypothetical protein [Prevotella sp.]MCM1406925.1 hypothetical protein [Treponema brennaborense]MCM1470076.1 hypothetical protein [Bacteroides sp.]